MNVLLALLQLRVRICLPKQTQLRGLAPNVLHINMRFKRDPKVTLTIKGNKATHPQNSSGSMKLKRSTLSRTRNADLRGTQASFVRCDVGRNAGPACPTPVRGVERTQSSFVRHGLGAMQTLFVLHGAVMNAGLLCPARCLEWLKQASFGEDRWVGPTTVRRETDADRCSIVWSAG